LPSARAESCTPPAASLDNLVIHRFDGVGIRGLQLNHPAV